MSWPLLGVLMLRGAQTPGELKQRGERLHGFADLGAVQATLDALVERGYVARHERRPGQKELRYEQLLGSEVVESAETSAETVAEDDLVPAEDRLTRLERELGELRAELGRLREALGEG